MNETERLTNKVIGHGMLVLLIGLFAGFGLIFSLMDAIALWPLPAIDAKIPGTTRGWQAAHVGGIMNGIMMAGVALLMSRFQLTGKRLAWVGWGMIITGWGNTLFIWRATCLKIGACPWATRPSARVISGERFLLLAVLAQCCSPSSQL